jgi:hypothetical protein
VAPPGDSGRQSTGRDVWRAPLWNTTRRDERRVSGRGLRLEALGVGRRRQLHGTGTANHRRGGGSRIRTVKVADIHEARPYLGQFLALLERSKVVLLCGNKAQDGWARARPAFQGTVIETPHPSRPGH